MSYNIPSKDNIVFDFKQANIIQQGLFFSFEQGDHKRVYSQGIGSPAISAPAIKNVSDVPVKRIDNFIFKAAVYPVPNKDDIEFSFKINDSAFVVAVGFDSNIFGQAILRQPRFITIDNGIDSLTIGNATLQNLTSYIAVIGNDSLIFGLPSLKNQKQVIQPISINGLDFGNTQIDIPCIIPDFIFSNTPYTPPIIIDFVFGAGGKHGFIYTAGIDGLAFGHTTIVSNQIVGLQGFNSQAIGNPIIYNRTQYITVPAINPPQWYGEHKIELWQRYVNPQGVFTQVIGQATVTHGVREIISQGNDHLVFGTPWLSYYTRILNPPSIFNNSPASLHRVSRAIVIAPKGFEATQWGERIIPESMTIYPQGIESVVGTPFIDWHTRYITPKGFETSYDGRDGSNVRFGHLQIFNSDQYIIQEYDNDNGLNPPPFGQWTSIENRNKTLATFGSNSQKFGYALVYNNARVINPAPITGEVGRPFVGDRIRCVYPEAIESPYMAAWYVIHNTAFVLVPKGIEATQFGKHTIASNLQTIRPLGFEAERIGKPMIAYAIRAINIDNRYSIAPPYITPPTVQLYTHYIEPKSFDASTRWQNEMGIPAVSIHRNIIAPTWIDKQWFGEPTLKNVTPEIKVNGHNNEEFGTPSIRTQWRGIETLGDRTELFGQPEIAYRTKTIYVKGFEPPAISQLHRVELEASPPYSTQYINLNTLSNGIKPAGDEERQVGIPNMNQYVLYLDGFKSEKFGDTRVTANSIRIESGIFILGVGTPTVWMKRQYISPTGINNLIDESRVGKPRMSPHTIYAPMGEEATNQARNNHPVANPVPVNAGVKFGAVTITNQHRYIVLTGKDGQTLDGLQMGVPSIELQKRYISPRGWKGGNFGWHIIPNAPQTIEQYWEDEQDSLQVFGTTTISHPVNTTQTIVAPSILSQEFGDMDIQNFVRTIRPDTFDALRMGQSLGGDNPFMWQGLRIGELVSGEYGGDDHAKFGTTWISHKVRGIEAQGFDALKMENEVSDFKKRMTVTRTPKPVIKTNVAIQGFDTAQIGIPKLKHGQYFIHPDGNSETYRQGIGETT